MASSPPPEVKSIRELTDKLTVAFTNSPVPISGKLVGKGLISEKVRDQIVHGSDLPSKQAAILVEGVINKMKQFPKKFKFFLGILSEHSDTISLVEVLRSTHQKLVEETAQDLSSEDFCAQPMPKQLKLIEPRGRIRSFLSDEPDVCEAAEIPYRKSSLDISNPVIEKFSELGEDDKVNVTGQLQSLAEIIEEEFLKLREQLLQSLTARKVEPKFLIITLTQCEVYSTEKERTVKLLQLHKKELSEAKDICDIFLVISPYYSWFNYELFKKIVCTHGSDEDKENMEQYCQDFSEYCQKIPCVEFQENNSKSSCQTKIKFKLDHDIESLNIYDIKRIECNIAKNFKLATKCTGLE